jgi:hypothetical protein
MKMNTIWVMLILGTGGNASNVVSNVYKDKSGYTEIDYREAPIKSYRNEAECKNAMVIVKGNLYDYGAKLSVQCIAVQLP